MIKLLNLILITIAIFLSSSRADDSLQNIIKNLNRDLSKSGTIDYAKACGTCSLTKQASFPKANLFSKSNNQTISLSILTEDEVSLIFNELSSNVDIPFKYPVDGCYARAHKMVQILEKKGIIAGKAFVEGELYVDSKIFGEIGWSYHVAPVVLVKKGNENIPYIIDPSLFSKPVTFEEWKKTMLSKPKSVFEKEYFTNRFAYDPRDGESKLSTYTNESIKDMESTIKNYSEQLKSLNVSTSSN